jgi:hypothetical protein
MYQQRILTLVYHTKAYFSSITENLLKNKQICHIFFTTHLIDRHTIPLYTFLYYKHLYLFHFTRKIVICEL